MPRFTMSRFKNQMHASAPLLSIDFAVNGLFAKLSEKIHWNHVMFCFSLPTVTTL